MIGKITGGGSFGGALEYLMTPKERGKEREEEQPYREQRPGLDEHAPPYEEGERHRIIGGNMSGQTREELAKEFEAISRQRPNIEKPVHHASLTAHEKDEISVDKWREIAAEYVEKMGFGDAPYLVVQHRDGAADHIHILTSRVDVKGQVISDWQCKQRGEKVIREIEKAHGLEQTKSSHEVERAAPTRGELERFKRTGELSAKMELQGHVDLALRDAPTATEFIERLNISGIEVIPYIQKSGRMTGISFRKGKELMKGSDLGRGFSWPALQRRGLDYQMERDRPTIEAAQERSALSRSETIPSLMPKRSVVDFTKDMSRTAGQYLLDQANPVRQMENQIHAYQQVGRSITDGVSALREMVTKQNNLESLQRATGLDPSGKDGIERLQQAAGIEPARDGHDALEELSKITGLDRPGQPSDLTHTLDDTLTQTPGIPAMEAPAEEQTLDIALDFIL